MSFGFRNMAHCVIARSGSPVRIRMKSLPIAFEIPRSLVVAAVALVLAVAGCATPDDRTVQERANDEVIVRRVEAALTAATYVDADHVTVEVRRGVAIVSGLVADPEELAGVLRICQSVPGVRDVDDQLEIFDFTQSGAEAEGHVQ